MNNKPTILGKTYDYGYNGPNAPETIRVQLDLDGDGYYAELHVYSNGQSCEEADIKAKNGELRLIEELKRFVEKYEKNSPCQIKIERLEDYCLNENSEIVKKL